MQYKNQGGLSTQYARCLDEYHNESMREDGELAYDEVMINATIFTDEPVKMNDIDESFKRKLNLSDKDDKFVTKINSGKLKEEKKSNAVVIEESPAKYYLDITFNKILDQLSPAVLSSPFNKRN